MLLILLIDAWVGVLSSCFVPNARMFSAPCYRHVWSLSPGTRHSPRSVGHVFAYKPPPELLRFAT